MDELGQWGKEHANHPANVAKPMVDRLVNGIREDKMDEFLAGLTTGWGRREVAALMTPHPPRPQIRVLTVRHGMGHHNDMHGGLSLFNRDASLNRVGVSQAEAAGAVLAASSHFDKLDLVVVSPFRRTLETAARMLMAARDKGHSIRTVVHPLAAEHTLLRSGLQQGDRGSTAEQLRELFPATEYPQYDFDEIDRYCAERGLADGKWWHHIAVDASDFVDCIMPHETHESFGERAAAFRSWLGAEAGRSGAANVMVISHGGLLTTAFGGPEYGNVEFRLFDLLPDGSYTRVSPVSDKETPTIVREEARPGDPEKGDSEEVTYYIVRFGDTGPELAKRYNDFLDLKRALKVAGRERYKAVFPSKAHGAMMGIAGGELDGLVETRRVKLEAWLQQIVHQHSIHDETIAAWAAGNGAAGVGYTAQAPAAVGGSEPEPEPELELEPEPEQHLAVGIPGEGTIEGISVSVLGTVKRADVSSGGSYTFYIVSVTAADKNGALEAQGANVERRYSDFLQLKHELKVAGLERYSADFPRKYETKHRQTMLEGWLRKVLRTHGCFQQHVVKFLTPAPPAD